LETADNTQNILVRKVYHRTWAGLFSLFIHELLTSVAFCWFVWGLGFVVLVSGHFFRVLGKGGRAYPSQTYKMAIRSLEITYQY